MSTALRRSLHNRTTARQSSARGHLSPHGGSAARKLRLVQSQPMPSMRFSLLCLAVLLAGVVLVLLASIYISHTTYKINALTERQEALHSERDRLSEDISYRQSPQNIQKEASRSGLVPATHVSFILPDGSIVDAPDQAGKRMGSVPGPRADTRQDVRPNLRSNETLPAVGGGGQTLDAPRIKNPG